MGCKHRFHRRILPTSNKRLSRIMRTEHKDKEKIDSGPQFVARLVFPWF
jgi:hypothetical protein